MEHRTEILVLIYRDARKPRRNQLAHAGIFTQSAKCANYNFFIIKDTLTSKALAILFDCSHARRIVPICPIANGEVAAYAHKQSYVRVLLKKTMCFITGLSQAIGL